MIKKLFLMSVMMGAAHFGFSQHVVKGKVNNERGLVPGATVMITSGGTTLSETTTDMDGLYRFELEEPGEYTLTVREDGHEPENYTARIKESDVFHLKNFVLKPEEKIVYRIPDGYFFPEEHELTTHGKEMVYQIGKILKNMPHIKVELKTDDGQATEDMIQQKELAVKKFLMKMGVSQERFASSGGSRS